VTLNADERQAIVTYRLEKAESTYNDVLKSMEFGMFSTAANRLYYCFYYAASALLISKGIETGITRQNQKPNLTKQHC